MTHNNISWRDRAADLRDRSIVGIYNPDDVVQSLIDVLVQVESGEIRTLPTFLFRLEQQLDAQRLARTFPS